ncbi:hypothetical protein [Haliscomenobacter sp.]|uniref:hypothetical protein n=1 Tax=Haliscomenobacter sp. TaxID=2717303 RepID=UPI003BAA2D66
MKGFLVITTTVAFLGMFAAATSAQTVRVIGSTPGFSSSQPTTTTPSINSANRRYDQPRVDYRTPPPNYDSRYGRNDPYRNDRDDRDRRGSDCDDDRRGGYGSRDDDRRGGGYYGSRGDDRRRYEHRDNDRYCSCDKCHHHHDDDRYGRSTSSRDRDRGYVDYRDRDRYERSRGSSCPPKGKGKYGRD